MGAVVARGSALASGGRVATKLEPCPAIEYSQCLYFSGVSWKATALRTVVEREAEGSSRRTALRQGKQAVRAALKITKSYLNCRPHALREAALICVLDGQQDRAVRFFAESQRVAEEQRARYELAKSLLAQGEAGLKFGWPEAARQVDEARLALRVIEDF